MDRSIVSVGLFAMMAFAIGLAGCNTDTSNKPAAPPVQRPANEHAGHEHSAADMEKVKAELAKLSPEDATSAEKQHVCPVSGEMLGSMGPPKKLEVNGQQVWICCDGCKDELMANPDKYLAKLKKS
jgi:hypothetical protein